MEKRSLVAVALSLVACSSSTIDTQSSVPDLLPSSTASPPPPAPSSDAATAEASNNSGVMPPAYGCASATTEESTCFSNASATQSATFSASDKTLTIQCDDGSDSVTITLDGYIGVGDYYNMPFVHGGSQGVTHVSVTTATSNATTGTKVEGQFQTACLSTADSGASSQASGSIDAIVGSGK